MCVQKQEADNLEGEAGSEKTGNKITQEGFKAWSFWCQINEYSEGKQADVISQRLWRGIA